MLWLRRLHERERYSLYLAQVHQAGASRLDTLPPDLFFPTGLAVERSQPVTLPDGLIGSFTLVYSSEPQPDAPWRKRAELRAMTDVAGFTRAASEVWTLGTWPDWHPDTPLGTWRYYFTVSVFGAFA